jgi:serpin B
MTITKENDMRPPDTKPSPISWLLAFTSSIPVLALVAAGSVLPPVRAEDHQPKHQSVGQRGPAPAFTHVLATEAEYYTTGPQQGRPPEGRFPAGTEVELIREAGSYSLVQSADGIRAYVATGSLQVLTGGEDAMRTDVSAVVRGNNRFALDLYERLRTGQPGNLFVSPVSLSTALAMTYTGARGRTAEEMAEVLHLDLPSEKLHPAFASLREALDQGAAKRGYRLIVANRLWGQAGYDFLPEFLTVTRERYGAELAQVDFAGQAERARQRINAWVEEQTQALIRDLIPSGVLDPMTRLVLTNAIYFKGDWTKPFEKRVTTDAPFHVPRRQKLDVPLMYQESRFPFWAGEDLKILELPYGTGDLSMLVLLPDQIEGLADLEARLTEGNLTRWQSALRRETVRVYFPRFKLTSQFQLASPLKALGMTLAFTPDEADFSGMDGQQGLFVSAVIHKAFVDVNEEGTEAAAATGIAVGGTSVLIPEEPPVFRADHPFVFLIRDHRTGSIVFLGRLLNPQG